MKYQGSFGPDNQKAFVSKVPSSMLKKQKEKKEMNTDFSFDIGPK